MPENQIEPGDVGTVEFEIDGSLFQIPIYDVPVYGFHRGFTAPETGTTYYLGDPVHIQ